MNRRVVVTGTGPVTSVGVGAQEFHRAQLAGVSGVRPLTRFPARELGLEVEIAGEVDLPDELAPTARQRATTDRCTQLALVAARLAVRDARLDLAALDRDRIGTAVGTGIGGTSVWDEVAHAVVEKGPARLGSRMIPKAMCNSSTAVVAIEFGLNGPSITCALACAAGADALVAAFQAIRCGEADVMLAGGAEAPVVPFVVGGFSSMRALSRRNEDPAGASRPFSADRDGFVLAEGAAVLVLESEEHALDRGAPILAEFAGYGRSCDALHVTMPQSDGIVAARAIEAALRSAHMTPDDLSYVNAHGTATQFNDAAETKALLLALGDAATRIPVSSTKSQTGHSLGASGAIEAVAAVQAIGSGLVPPTINLHRPDPALGLDFVPEGPRETKVDAVLSNSFAFGGHNVSLLLTRYR